jgi:hypothetical protein
VALSRKNVKLVHAKHRYKKKKKKEEEDEKKEERRIGHLTKKT